MPQVELSKGQTCIPHMRKPARYDLHGYCAPRPSTPTIIMIYRPKEQRYHSQQVTCLLLLCFWWHSCSQLIHKVYVSAASGDSKFRLCTALAPRDLNKWHKAPSVGHHGSSAQSCIGANISLPVSTPSTVSLLLRQGGRRRGRSEKTKGKRCYMQETPHRESRFISFPPMLTSLSPPPRAAVSLTEYLPRSPFTIISYSL